MRATRAAGRGREGAEGGGGRETTGKAERPAPPMPVPTRPLLPSRLVWTLVHSTWLSDCRRGRDLAEALASDPAADPAAARDLLYLQAVAAHKLGDNVGARRLLARLLAGGPCRQGEALKVAVDDAVVRDGLVGLGVGAALVAAAGFAIASFMRRT